MSSAPSYDGSDYVRPNRVRRGPNRGPLGYYRPASGLKGTDYFGVPLKTTEDVVVAAVRTAYDIADAQIERGIDAARALRSAAQRQGIADAGAAVDAGERLARKAVLMGVEWLESAAAEPGSPIKRLLAAEYRLLGSMLGLTPEKAEKKGGKKAEKEPEPTNRSDKLTPTAPAHPAPAPAASATAATTEAGAGPPQRADRARRRHAGDSAMRSFKIASWQLDGEIPEKGYRLKFYHVDQPSSGEMGGWVIGDKPLPTLELTTLVAHPPGLWRAAVCDGDRTQVGTIEVVL